MSKSFNDYRVKCRLKDGFETSAEVRARSFAEAEECARASLKWRYLTTPPDAWVIDYIQVL